MSAFLTEREQSQHIQELANTVDNKFESKPKFMGCKRFLEKNWISLVNVVFLMTVLILLIIMLSDLSKAVTLNLDQLQPGTALALGLSLVAGFTATMSLFIGVLKIVKPAKLTDDVVTYNFAIMQKIITDSNDLPLVKALIILKSKNPDIKLDYLYNNHNELFDKKRLLELLISFTPKSEDKVDD
jgi:hypothetical protein